MTDQDLKIDRYHARLCRARDARWGWAIAYLIPYVGFYHVITRKTITPAIAGALGAFASLAISGAYIEVGGYKNNEDARSVIVLLGFLATVPGATKLGIEWDRRRAVKELEAQNKEEDK